MNSNIILNPTNWITFEQSMHAQYESIVNLMSIAAAPYCSSVVLKCLSEKRVHHGKVIKESVLQSALVHCM